MGSLHDQPFEKLQTVLQVCNSPYISTSQTGRSQFSKHLPSSCLQTRYSISASIAGMKQHLIMVCNHTFLKNGMLNTFSLYEHGGVHMYSDMCMCVCCYVHRVQEWSSSIILQELSILLFFKGLSNLYSKLFTNPCSLGNIFMYRQISILFIDEDVGCQTSSVCYLFLSSR